MEAKKKKKNRSESRLRTLIQAFFLVLMTYLAALYAAKGLSGGYYGVDTLCPFGGVESLYAIIISGAFLKRVALPAIVLLVGTILTALVLGRAFCGVICPLGTIQEWLYKLGQKILPAKFRKKLVIPATVDRPLRYLKYLMLIVILIFTYITGTLVFRPFDPWATFGHIWSGNWVELAADFFWGLIVLGLVILAGFFFSRLWCKYLCPLGALLGPFAKIALFKIQRNEKTCTHCNACDRACPMDVKVESASRVTDMECIECGDCVTACPVPGTLERKAKAPAVKLAPVLVPLLVMALFFGTYGIAKLAGIWKPAGLISSFTEIKGNSSLQQVAEAAGVTVAKLLETAGLPAEMAQDAALPMKTLKSDEYLKKYNIPSFDVDTIREAFATLTGERFVPETETEMKEPAASASLGSPAPSASGKPEASAKASATTGTKVPATASHDPEKTLAPLAPGAKPVWGQNVTGSTPLKDILKMTNKSLSEFSAKFGLPANLDTSLTLKDIRDKYGKDMEEMKGYFGM